MVSRGQRARPAPTPWTSDPRLTFYDWLLWDSQCGREAWPAVVDLLLAMQLPVAVYDLAVDRLHDRLDPP